MPFEVILILLLILANGLLSMSEIAIISARKARLQQRANEGDEKARAALALATDPGDFLSTVQIGITLVGILTGVFGGATIATTVSGWLNAIPPLSPYSRAISVALVVVVITYLTLVLGELVPKRLALNRPEGIAAAVAGPMRLFSTLTSPLVRLLSFSTNLVLRSFGIKPTTDPPITEEEIQLLLEQGTRAGVFEAAEQEMVAGVFRLGDRRIGSLMIPRPEIVWLDLEDPPAINQRHIVESVHSRFPVAQGDLDNLQGIVQSKDLLARSLAGLPFDIEAVLHAPLFVPEGMPALRVLEMFRESRIHIALVIDEFGGLVGLATIRDIIEAIVGDFPHIGETGEPEAVQRDDGSWLMDGMLSVEEFMEIFALRSLPDEDRGLYQTLGGFVVTCLGRIPDAGDHFEWNGLRVEVVDMDGLRVDKVIVTPIAPKSPGTTNNQAGAR